MISFLSFVLCSLGGGGVLWDWLLLKYLAVYFGKNLQNSEFKESDCDLVFLDLANAVCALAEPSYFFFSGFGGIFK